MTSGAEGLRRRPLLFVTNLDEPELEPDDHHHLARVLRVRPGSEVTLADGTGRWRVGHFDRHLRAVGEVVPAGHGNGGPLVAFTPVKGDRPEWVVQKLTELGVATIVVVQSERSVVRWTSERAARQLERFARVAREACMQSRRLRLPSVEGILPVAEVLRRPGVAVAEPGGRRPEQRDAGLVIGPEGGWTPEELALAEAQVRLPGEILRAETAAVVAGAVLVALRDGLVAPRGP